MKNFKRLLFLFILHCSQQVSGQVLCVNCYNMNSTISPNASNFIINGGFENTTCLSFPGSFDTFCPVAFGYNCDIQNWACTGGGQNTYTHIFDTSSYVIIPEGTKAAYFGNAFSNPCSPTQYDTSCWSQAGCIVTNIPAGYPVSDSLNGGSTGVSLEQTVTGLIPGSIYVLEFWSGGENAGTGFNGTDGLFAVDVGFGNIFLRDPITSNVFLPGIGRVYLIQFIATSANHNFKFTNWGHTCQYCTELLLDNVRLYSQSQLSNSYPHCTTGMNQLSEHINVSISPNPFSEQLKVELPINEPATLNIYDITSRCILTTSISGTCTLNTKSLPAGTFVYQIRTDSGLFDNGKIIKY